MLSVPTRRDPRRVLDSTLIRARLLHSTTAPRFKIKQWYEIVGSVFQTVLTMNSNDDPIPYPFYGAKYHVYTASPYYRGSAPILDSLQIHERRFRDTVLGDRLRGIQIANELAGSGSRVSGGTFKSCSWRLIGSEKEWNKRYNNEENDNDNNDEEDEMSMLDLSAQEARGAYVEIRYERATYNAVLIGDPKEKSRIDGFTNLPLLLVKMPTALREAFVHYLTTTFDSRITPMKLRSAFLSKSLENILENAATRHTESLQELSEFPRGLSVQLAFPSTAPDLRFIDLHLHQSDLLELRKHGETIWRQLQGTLSNDNSKDYRTLTHPHITGPFTAALSDYLQQHLGLDFSHPAVILSKFMLGSFDLSNDGRIKVSDPSSDGASIFYMLLQEASLPILADRQHTANRKGKELRAKAGSAAVENRRNMRLPTRESVPQSVRSSARLYTDPPPPYEMFDSGMADDLNPDV